MWFTDNPCDEKNEKWYYLISFIVLIANISIVMRQLLGVEEIAMHEIFIGTVLSIGVLFIIVTYIVKMYTGGCFGINEWWVLLSVANYPIILIINEMTYEIAHPIAMFPFFFMYPAVTIRARGRDAAVGATIATAVLFVITVVLYFYVTSSDWWHYGVIFTGATSLKKVYMYTTAGMMLGGAFAIFIALIPIKIGDYALPGYYMWKYRDTAIICAIIGAVILYLISYGGLLRTLVNVAYRGYAIV